MFLSFNCIFLFLSKKKKNCIFLLINLSVFLDYFGTALISFLCSSFVRPIYLFRFGFSLANLLFLCIKNCTSQVSIAYSNNNFYFFYLGKVSMELIKGINFGGFLVSLLFFNVLVSTVFGIGVNWGTQATHPLSASTVVKMLKDNGFQQVKLFDADPTILNALGKSGIQVMVGIPNDMLASLAGSVQAAEDWVAQNVSSHINSNGVDIRYVAVGNEPFLSTYNGTFLATTYPALQNIQSAIIKAGLANRVKVTIPLNADVYSSSSQNPSDGDFRSDIHPLMLEIVKFLSDNGAPFTVNIYPFISLYNDPNFPADYAFFNGYSTPINDNGRIYDNVYDANLDTLIWSLQKNGYGNLSIIIGEIGWPTDGDRNANLQSAQRFNQGFMARYIKGTGTPMRPGKLDAYLFGLIDEDAKSIQPGNFERHWGIFYFDGTAKYPLNLGTSSNGLVPASNVHYLAKKWCIFSPSASPDDSQVAPSVAYACANADCTSLGYGTSCGNLDARGNISYAFNSYFQIQNQEDRACKFPNISTITTQDPSPSQGDCKFRIMIQPTSSGGGGGGSSSSSSRSSSGVGFLEKPVSMVLFMFMFFFTIM